MRRGEEEKGKRPKKNRRNLCSRAPSRAPAVWACKKKGERETLSVTLGKPPFPKGGWGDQARRPSSMKRTPEREGDPGPQRSLLGLPPGLNCDGHTLTETDGGYELSLAVADEGNPVDTVVLELERRGERLVPLGYTAAGSVTQLFFTTALGLSMSYRDWEFK